MPDDKKIADSPLTDAALNAEELAKEFREHSVAEFFKKNRQMLGLSGKIKALTTIIHEYVSNSLDACEEAKVFPEIEVRISELGDEYYEVRISDNGPGLAKETVGKALGQLLAGTKFHRLIQQRGQQGIGAAGCTMLSLMTTGKPIQVVSGTAKGAFSCEMTIDPKANQPKIITMENLNKSFKGLAIKAKFKDIKYQKSEQGPYEYLRRTAIANPHASITLIEPDGTKTTFKKTSKSIPARPVATAPHPKGVTVDELLEMAKHTSSRKTASFLKSEFDRMGDKALDDIAKKVSFDLNKDPAKLAWDEAEEIIKCFKTLSFIAPRTDILRPIGEDQIKTSLETIVKPEFLSVVERKPAVYHGYAFQVEVAVAYGGEAGRTGSKNEEGVEQRKIEIMRFANRVPLLFDSGGCALTKAVQSIDWKRYGIKDFENMPMTIFVHFLSVHIPYTGAGKQAVADEDEVMEELRLAIMDTGRKIYRYMSFKRREEEKQKKRKLFMKYATEVAIGLSELTGEKKTDIEKRLHDIVLSRLKIEEEKMANEEIPEEMSDEELAKEAEKEKKEKSKKKKKSRLGDDEGGDE